MGGEGVERIDFFIVFIFFFDTEDLDFIYYSDDSDVEVIGVDGVDR